MRQLPGRAIATVFLLLPVACAHSPLRAQALAEVERPAIVARIEETGGPHSKVFRSDSTFGPRLKTLDPREADRRLVTRLEDGYSDPATHTQVRALSRFEIADALRAQLQAQLPGEAPWTELISPIEVARVFESFLVKEVPANAPDYQRLRPLGVDAVVEIVIEDYGLRSEEGRVGAYLVGSARLFRIDGGELYHRHFFSDDLKAGLEPLDPFVVAKNPQLFGDRIQQMVAAIAAQVAADLSLGAEPAHAAPVRRNAAPQGVAPAADDPL
jgi:hypothetical protein